MTAKHRSTAKETETADLKPEEGVKEKHSQAELADASSKIDSMQQCLIWIRDNVVSANEAHVLKINKVLGVK